MKKLIISLLGLAFSSVAFGYIVPQYVFVRCPLFLTCTTSKISSCGDSGDLGGPLVPPFTKITLHDGKVSPGAYRINMVVGSPKLKYKQSATCIYVQNLSIKTSVIWLQSPLNDLVINMDPPGTRWNMNTYKCDAEARAAANRCLFQYK